MMATYGEKAVNAESGNRYASVRSWLGGKGTEGGEGSSTASGGGGAYVDSVATGEDGHGKYLGISLDLEVNSERTSR
jgi:hypothetical protein